MLGTPPCSTRVPGHIMGSFADKYKFHDFLLAPASGHGFETRTEYIDTLARAKEIRARSHQIAFPHGDLRPHNVHVDEDVHLAGLLDWEFARWYPE